MTQLFSNEYFGIGLIVTIAFLTILFIIVLIMALKDAKKRKNEEEVKEEEENPSDFAFKEQAEEVKLEVPEITEVAQVKEDKPVDIEPTKEEEVKEEVEVTADDEFKTADFSFSEVEKEKEAVDSEPTVKIDFEALAESLKAELDKEVNEEVVEDNGNNFELNPNELFQDNREETNLSDSINLEELKKFASELQKEEDKPILETNEETIKVVPEENSNENVYLNNENEKVVKEEKVFEPVKMKVPNIVMPKFASNDSVKVEKVEPVEDKKEEEVVTPSFENIENETFSLK